MSNSKQRMTYKNVEKKMSPDGCITRKVVIYENGRGYKSITTNCPDGTTKSKTRKNKTVRKPLSESEISDIQKRQFIRGLFDSCK